ncbi:hypothetical protein AERO8C_20345 [Aeromonas veronii]|uniref:Uncharacterized protein n=1 Tax=Aeromonas veronii TaxID=654 RepID=A0A653L2N8_AERVE|nr:hypothetical protein AERO8C_20345 [Aeromonas veronii]
MRKLSSYGVWDTYSKMNYTLVYVIINRVKSCVPININI